MIDGKPGKPSSKGVTQWLIDENGAKSSFTVGINLENLELKGDTNSNKSKSLMIISLWSLISNHVLCADYIM